MVKVNIIGQMVQHILVILYKVKDKDLVNGDLVKQMVIFILENIKKIKNQGKVNIYGLMDVNFKETSQLI